MCVISDTAQMGVPWRKAIFRILVSKAAVAFNVGHAGHKTSYLHLCLCLQAIELSVDCCNLARGFVKKIGVSALASLVLTFRKQHPFVLVPRLSLTQLAVGMTHIFVHTFCAQPGKRLLNS